MHIPIYMHIYTYIDTHIDGVVGGGGRQQTSRCAKIVEGIWKVIVLSLQLHYKSAIFFSKLKNYFFKLCF